MQLDCTARKAISAGQIGKNRMHQIARSIARAAGKCATVLAVIATAGTANISPGRANEANAKSLLKAMSDYLRAQKAMSFD
jgi:hypothetical protein